LGQSVRGEARAHRVAEGATHSRRVIHSELILSLSDYARQLSESLDALRAVVAGKAKKLGFAQFDGHEFWKENGDWCLRIGVPWIRGGALRRWISVDDAARILGVTPQTLRRRLQRRLVTKHGVRTARCEGILAYKFSRSWRICLVRGLAKHG